MSKSLVKNAAEVFFCRVVQFFSDMGKTFPCGNEYENSNKPVQNIEITETYL